ncbi:MAG: creatininase family protein [Planctomycetes bacterium]|nr:creatininase family protein [Planctomycetota bacterium]
MSGSTDREVRYERLRPAQIVEARSARSIAYIPIGTIEWHGAHNPVGLDTLKVHALAIRCARAGGGLVFPPLYYGESRVEALMEAAAVDRLAIAAAMGLEAANFEPSRFRRSAAEQARAYQELLLHILDEVRSLGFQVAVFAAGHYPLLDHARAAAATWWQYGKYHGKSMIPWAFSGYELVRDLFPEAGDHAGPWETSLLLALEPDLVEMGTIADPLVGVLAARSPGEATRAFGERAIAAIVERASTAACDRLENPDRYQGHGLRF